MFFLVFLPGDPSADAGEGFGIKDFMPGGSAQLTEKAQFGEENPRKSKRFILLDF
jgi:hypothetical protein